MVSPGLRQDTQLLRNRVGGDNVKKRRDGSGEEREIEGPGGVNKGCFVLIVN